MNDRRRELPSVDRLLLEPEIRELLRTAPRIAVVDAVRESLAAARTRRAGPPDSWAADVRERLTERVRASLRPVHNATGVVLHTNLGRAPIARFVPLPGYSNLEYDLSAGRRGKRDAHVAGLLERVLGRPAIVVNNNAAAVYLALNELAADSEVIVSRGELIEIGDGFRIPDIMRRSGALLREVGTTNRTGLDDYRAAIGERTRLILLVHPSNFRITGFTTKPERGEIVALARERGLPVYEDLGSGRVANLPGIDEPSVAEAVEAGVDLVSFSGDKLLGGPQAGILAGRADLVARLRRNAMFRALRVDKLILQALETTLRHVLLEEWDRVPALAMARMTADELRDRAGRLAAGIEGAELIEGRSVIGGGSTPEQSLPAWLVALDGDAEALEERLRLGDPAVIARIEDGRVVFDLRTVFPGEEEELAARIQEARSR
ncbi:MAG: L-seryl-tRNA(Sec) selenium transferase [Bryobacteraceae bacterium]